jgi:Arylsulfotransferase (ASST)
VVEHRTLAAACLLLVAAALAGASFAAGLWGGSSAKQAPRKPDRPLATDSTLAPGCTPQILNRSAVLPGTSLSVSPLPGTMVAEPSTQISLLGVPADEIAGVSVTGSHTGRHAGRLRAYSQGDGASFVLQRKLSAGERVTVRGALLPARGRRSFQYSFTVARQDPLPDITARYKPSASPVGLEHFHSAPDLRAPTVHVSTPARAGSEPGDIFAGVYASANGPGGPLIFGDDGQLVWFKPLPAKISATNLQLQRYEGQPALSWWQGKLLPQGFGEGEEIIDNDAYRQVAVVRAGNGLYADLHDFQIDADDTALLTAYDPVHCDLASIGGPADAAVTDGVFQEIDLKTGLVRREWHALDHVAITATYAKLEAAKARTAFPFDFFHINSLQQIPGGQTLVSARNTWTIYKLNATTGQVLTRIGGKHSSVEMGSGTRTAWQHDARMLANGEITVFDNGSEPKVQPQSRGIVERLDPATNTMTLLTQYTHSPKASAGTQGNVQTLPDENVMIGWGVEPYIDEYSADGKLLFGASVAAPSQSYRAFREVWSAQPASSPVLAVEKENGGDSSAAYASWNGATEVARWRVLAGRSRQRLAPVASAARSGFETAIPVPGSEPWLQLQALDQSGNVLGSSAAIRG